MTSIFFTKNKSAIVYGIAMAFILVVLKWLEFKLVIVDRTFEIYAGVIAVFFTALGIWLALKLSGPKIETIIIEKKVFVTSGPAFLVNEQEAVKLNISKRELEVLQLMAEGLSNQEISDRLFVSLNTIKTHASKLFEKMEVKRRTQAVEKAKRLNLIA